MAKRYPRCPDGGPSQCKQRAWCVLCTPKGRVYFKTGTPGTPPLDLAPEGKAFEPPARVSKKGPSDLDRS